MVYGKSSSDATLEELCSTLEELCSTLEELIINDELGATLELLGTIELEDIALDEEATGKLEASELEVSMALDISEDIATELDSIAVLEEATASLLEDSVLLDTHADKHTDAVAISAKRQCRDTIC